MNELYQTQVENKEDERTYSLREAAQMLDMTESALRMRIKRNSIHAEQEPMGDPETGRYRLKIPERELKRLQEQREARTQRGDASTAPDMNAPPPPSQNAPPNDERLEAALRKIEQLERELQHAKEQRDMQRELIRSIQARLEMLERIAGSDAL